MNGIGPFSGLTPDPFFELLAQEEERSLLFRRSLGLLRIEARAGLGTERDLYAFYKAVSAVLRRTDRVQAVGGRELAVAMPDTDSYQAEAACNRIRTALQLGGDRFRPLLGWSSARPERGQTWRDAWHIAGIFLVADAAVPAAA
jgi:hypothetical protein